MSILYANYHTHTWRCNHASGTEREYVECAIKNGIKVLGFSDHTPMPYPDGYLSRDKMRLSETEDYVDTVCALRDEYRGEIEIRLGLEVEYYPALFRDLLRFLEPYPIEYFLLGQHYLGNEIGEAFCGRPTADEGKLRQYCAQTAEALETGRFTYFAHPDVLNFTGDPGIYEQCMRGLCIRAKELHIPLEINLLGLGTNRHYPNRRFWEIAGEVGNEAVLGCDAHLPENVFVPAVIQAGRELAASCGVVLLDEVELRDPASNPFSE